MNIALVVLDTLRKDSFDESFGWLPGKRFENAYSTSSWTVPAHASLFTGYYSSELGVHSKNRNLNCPESTLPELLSSSGYKTACFSCNPYISKTFNFDRGFDEFGGGWRLQHHNPKIFDWEKFISNNSDGSSTRYVKAFWKCITEDCQTIPSLMHGVRLKMRGTGKSTKQFQDDGAQSALEYLRNKNIRSNEFLFMNLMEAHAPYTPPQKYRTVHIGERPGLLQTVTGDSSTDNKKVKRAYEDCVRYLSDIYEKIFEELKQDFDYIITLADHGEMFGEKGVWAHTHGVYPELTHVPLTIYNNDLEGVSEKPVSILDIHRTILEIAGIESKSRGQNLLGDFDESYKLTEYMGLTREDIDQLLKENVSKRTIDRYDSVFRGIVSNQGDYGYETVNGDQALNPNNKKVLTQYVESMKIRGVNDDLEEDISPEVKQQLEELGYA